MSDWRSTGPELDIPPDYFEPGRQRIYAEKAVWDAQCNLRTVGTQMSELFVAQEILEYPEDTLAYKAAERLLEAREGLLARFTEPAR